MSTQTNTGTDINIFAMTWNAAGIRICESTLADEKREVLKQRLFKAQSCVTPDFFEEIRGKIMEKKPHFVVVTTQDEDSSNTYFHSNYLQTQMPAMKYKYLRRFTARGIGEKASQLDYPDLSEEDGPKGSALRISLFIRIDIYPEIEAKEAELNEAIPQDKLDNVTYIDTIKAEKQSSYLRGLLKPEGLKSGAICMYVWFRDVKIAFIAVDFPIGRNVVDYANDRQAYRVERSNNNRRIMGEIYKKFYSKLDEKIRPKQVFLLGTFNYDIDRLDKEPGVIYQEFAQKPTYDLIIDYLQHEQLTNEKLLKESPFFGYNEGVNNYGPQFSITYQMKRNRGPGCVRGDYKPVNRNCFTDINPNQYISVGYHERILYKTMGLDNFKKGSEVTDLDSIKVGESIICTGYYSFDYGNIRKSTHVGVLGFYTITNVDIPKIDEKIENKIKELNTNSNNLIGLRRKLTEKMIELSKLEGKEERYDQRKLSFLLKGTSQQIEGQERIVKILTDEVNRLQSIKLSKLSFLYPADNQTVAQVNNTVNFQQKDETGIGDYIGSGFNALGQGIKSVGSSIGSGAKKLYSYVTSSNAPSALSVGKS